MVRFIVSPDGQVIDTATAPTHDASAHQPPAGEVSRFGRIVMLMVCGFLVGVLGSALLILLRDRVEATRGVGVIERIGFTGEVLGKKDMPWLAGTIRFETDGKLIRRQLLSGGGLTEAAYEHGQEVSVLYNPGSRRLTIEQPVSFFVFASVTFLLVGSVVCLILWKGHRRLRSVPAESSSALLRFFNRYAPALLTAVAIALGALYGAAFCGQNVGSEDLPDRPKIGSRSQVEGDNRTDT